MKVLICCPESPCYGIDTIASGMMQLIGRGNVRVFYSLTEGRKRTQFSQFEGLYQWAEGCDVDWPIEEADLFIVSYRVSSLPQEIIDFPDIPLVIIDDADGSNIVRPHGDRTLLVFKRENLGKLERWQRPLAFSAMPENINPKIFRERDIKVFFMAQSTWGTRGSVATLVTGLGGHGKIISEGSLISKQSYNNMLCNSLIGVSVRGAGYDTYRYWEIPYCGAMLMSDRSPNLIPDNFIDGEEAVFFNDTEDLESKIKYYLARPDEIERIAINGARKVRSHHMAIHRAKYVLQEVEKELSLACS